MNDLTFWHWFLIGYLVLSTLLIWKRGFLRQTRTYTPAEAVLGTIEFALLIWLVTAL